MKPKKTLVLIILFFLFPLALLAQASLPDSSKLVKLRIDPVNSLGASVSDVFSEVEFIPLETSKDCLFGNIENLKIVDDHFVFFDYDTRSVYIFTAQGKYKTKIDAKKVPQERSKKEENNFYGFVVEQVDGKDRIGIYTRKTMFFFDLDAKLVKKVSHDDPVRKNNRPKTYFKSQDAYVETYHLEKKDKDSIYYEIVTYNNNKETGKYFSYNPDKFRTDSPIGNGTGVFDYGADKEMFFVRPHDYTLYLATPDKLYMAYRFIFPFSLTLPADFSTAEEYKGKKFEYLRKNDKKIYGIGNTYQIGDNLFFKTHQMEFNQSQKNSFVYNFKNGRLLSMVDLQPDTLSQFLPVTDAGLGYDFRQRGFQLYKDGYFYTTYSSLVLYTVKDQNADKKRTYDDRLTQTFKKGSRKDNPIIVKLKPKTN
ncbi:hypothetical protein GCM10023149_15210 [Mucilaginibacter gynuensis]|uniref:6-bladed beta-propeller protein n=1 Tax=Mucilaginibacter gynuensis TaxID=1302236 RepID=A0ABP8G5T8_9SPHI